jgi:putative hydrolases of HD superfamily
MTVQTQTDLAAAVVRLGELSMEFGQVSRTGLPHADGSPESDTDHTVMLGLVATALASRWIEAALDVGLVAQYALVHDLAEVYVGDTDTYGASDAELVAKHEREEMGLAQLQLEFARVLPWLPSTLHRYEAQLDPESRFVRAVDKLCPRIVNILRGCAGIKERGASREDLADRLPVTEGRIQEWAGEVPGLMELAEELGREMVESYR